jgi:hypothetical protein
MKTLRNRSASFAPFTGFVFHQCYTRRKKCRQAGVLACGFAGDLRPKSTEKQASLFFCSRTARHNTVISVNTKVSGL